MFFSECVATPFDSSLLWPESITVSKIVPVKDKLFLVDKTYSGGGIIPISIPGGSVLEVESFLAKHQDNIVRRLEKFSNRSDIVLSKTIRIKEININTETYKIKDLTLKLNL